MPKDHHQDDELEVPFLLKSSKRQDRLNRNKSAKIHRERRNLKKEREFNDGFRGNYENEGE
jgi:hypothetical protein